MSFLKSAEDYYRKFIELQEKLRKSEEERLRLELKFNEMIQFTKDEEEAHHRKLQTQYQNFLIEDSKRQERNDRIVKVLERIENRAALLAAKTERFQLFRKQYTGYLKRMTGDVHYNSVCDSVSLHSGPGLKGFDVNRSCPSKSTPRSRVSERQGFPRESQNSDLYSHPTIKTVLNSGRRSLNDDLDSLKSYLNNLSPIPEKPSNVSDENASDSSENQEQPTGDAFPPQKNESKTEKINRWKPKFQLPRRNKNQFKRNRWQIPEKRYSPTCPKRESKFYPTASSSFEPNPAEACTSGMYQDIRRESRYNPISGIGSREHDFNFRPSSSSYQTDCPEKYSYLSTPTRNVMSDDLDYQLSNYPSLDVGDRINIEYTLYPKISDVSTYRNYPSSSYFDYQRDNYRGHSPSKDRVSWYDHYLGRCPPRDTNHESYSKYAQDTREINNYTKNDYNPSKKKQDSILLDSEIRNSRYPDNTKTPVYQPRKVESADVDRNYYTTNENDENIVQNSLSKDDFDETEDQVPSEVLHDDVLEAPKIPSTIKEVKFDIPSTSTTLYANERESRESKESSVLEDAVSENLGEEDDANDDYYEEKHDSLEEIQKENVIQEPISDVVQNEEDDDDICEVKDDEPQNNNNEIPEAKNDQHEYNLKEETAHDMLEQKLEKEEVCGVLEQKLEDEVLEQTLEENKKEENEVFSDQNETEEHEVILEEREEQINEVAQESGNADEGEQQFSKEEESNEKNIDENESKTAVDDTNTIINEQYEADEDIQNKIDHTESQGDQSNQQFTTDYENSEYQPDPQPTVQYDDSGQPIQYTVYDQENVQYDENGQPIGYGDGQYYPQYDENGQLIQQYDENGQPVVQYDENGQPIVQYDENGQPIVQYDENGQPLYQYDQYYQDQQFQHGQEQHYEEGEQQYQEGAENQYQEGQAQQYEAENSQYQEGDQQRQEGDQAYQEDVKEEREEPNPEPQQAEKSDSEKRDVPAKESDDKKMKVLEMLDTDSESTKQDTKVSNDSDFDFSNK